MWVYEVLIAFGMLLIIGLMVVLINPPEAWIKKAVYRKTKEHDTRGNPLD